MNNSIVPVLEVIMARRITALPKKLRLFTQEATRLPSSLLLTGPRGVGKSTFLLHHGRSRRFLYFCADNPLVMALNLSEVVQSIFMAGYEGVIIDEVHYAQDWSLHLKSLYDAYPAASFWISDSSSLLLRSGNADLSRRFVHLDMPIMSFREYLFLETGVIHPRYVPFSEGPALPVQPTAAILSAFGEYRRHGTRPFYGEGYFIERMLAVLDKGIHSDVPFFIPRIVDDNLRLMHAIVGTLGMATIPRLQVQSLCADWNIGADKLYTLLNIMEAVGILQIIRKENDRKAKSAGDKLFFADPVYYEVLGSLVGNAREAWVATCSKCAGWDVTTSRDKAQADFVISKEGRRITLEVGGKKKSRKGADFVIHDDIDYPTATAIPLWLLAMSW
jgi:predicted AAA+ superfamily ATPase